MKPRTMATAWADSSRRRGIRARTIEAQAQEEERVEAEISYDSELDRFCGRLRRSARNWQSRPTITSNAPSAHAADSFAIKARDYWCLQ